MPKTKKNGGLETISLDKLDERPSKKNKSSPKDEEEEIAQLRQMQELATAAYAMNNAKTKKEKESAERKMQKFRVHQEILKQQLHARQEQLLDYETREFDNDSCIVPLSDVVVRDAHDEEVKCEDWFLLGEKEIDGKMTKQWIRYEQFKSHHMDGLMYLFSQELSEPYSCFTYEHFCVGWPDLSVSVYGYTGETPPEKSDSNKLVGACVSKTGYKTVNSGDYRPLQGYIAMLAVVPAFRGHKLGQKLVRLTVSLMKKKDVDEVVLETPTYNEHAMKLYLDVGFIKKCFLTRYYLDGSDAVRLILWLKTLQL